MTVADGIPVHNARGPSRSFPVGEFANRERWPILHGNELDFGEGVVVIHARGPVRRLIPSQWSMAKRRGSIKCRIVIAVQHGLIVEHRDASE